MNYTNDEPSQLRFKNAMGIRGRLFLGFFILIVIIVAAVSVVLTEISFTKSAAINTLSTDLPSHEAFYDLEIQLLSSRGALFSWYLTQNPIYKTEFANSWNNTDKIERQVDMYSKNWTNTEIYNSWEKVKSLLSQLHTTEANLMNTIVTDKNAETQQFETQVFPLINQILDTLDGPLNVNGERTGGMFEKQMQLLQAGTHQILNNITTIQIIEYALLALIIIAAIIISFLTAHKILIPLNNAINITKKIAAGDLTQRLFVETNDEVGRLGSDLNTMTDNLAKITKQVIETCHNMVSSLDEVKHAVAAQSTGASEQAASVNQITASLEEIEKSSFQTMEKAKSLGEAAERTKEKGLLGIDSVGQSVSGMKTVRDKVQMIAQTILDLSNQTQQVGEITNVVSNLAQQSKMLALNASIEASKAGEAGKGFSVVASEVRNLAEQSEHSTAQVQKILEDIRFATEKAVMATEEGAKGVEQGTTLVEQTGDVVRSLSDVIHETTLATEQIQAAIRQEGIGIEQITQGMNEINQVTASFVESVNQTTEAIANLVNIAKALKDYIDLYKI